MEAVSVYLHRTDSLCTALLATVLFGPVPGACTLVKKCRQFYSPGMTVEQLKLAEWLHFRVVDKPTYLCAERWVLSDSPCGWEGLGPRASEGCASRSGCHGGTWPDASRRSRGPWHRVCVSRTATPWETRDRAVLAAPALSSPHLDLLLETEGE